MAKVIGLVESVCPNCLKKIMGQKVEYEDGVYLEKNCEEHGFFKTLIWEKTMKIGVVLKNIQLQKF